MSKVKTGTLLYQLYKSTANNKTAVEVLTTRDEIAAYGYKSGYPTKLTFTL